jgi:hypothetical protein
LRLRSRPLASISAVAWTSVPLPTVIGEHVVVTKDGMEFRIACAGSGRWTVSARSDDFSLSATLELTAAVYHYSVAGGRGIDGGDWRELLVRQR